MTRINVVPVEELSDQHLIAEYRELPRCLKQNVNLKDAPKQYCLGKGHVKWARYHYQFIYQRFIAICKEFEYRGFKHNYSTNNLMSDFNNNEYVVTEIDINLNRNRIIERYLKRPNWYRWTKRMKPDWLK